MSLGLLETRFLSVTSVACEAALRAADVRLLSLEPIGTEAILSRFEGDVGAVQEAIDAASRAACKLGAPALSATVIPAPSPVLSAAPAAPHALNPLYGGREYFTPRDNPPLALRSDSLGILETQGLVAILSASDAMLKAASVKIISKEKIGVAYVSVVIRGDNGAVAAALQAGAKAVGSLGKLIATELIARPHPDLLALFAE
jgi:ethanolamine utilization protein EutM